MLAEFALTIFYTQVIVHLPGIEAPGLAWTDEHVAQGFAWAHDTVNCGLPDHDGECLLRVSIQPIDAELDPKALWAIGVPFDVKASPLSIGTVLNVRDVAVPCGLYSLVFEVLPGTGAFAFVVDLKFRQSAAPGFAILKQGSELRTDHVLLRDADRA